MTSEEFNDKYNSRIEGIIRQKEAGETTYGEAIEAIEKIVFACIEASK